MAQAHRNGRGAPGIDPEQAQASLAEPASTNGAGLGSAPGQRESAIEELSERDEAWLERVRAEFVAGFRAMSDGRPAVTVYGSARVKEGSPVYEDARQIGAALARAGFTVITGGGPGVMEAANRGAFEAGGRTVGMQITLRNVEPPNRWTTEAVTFKYFFVRKVMLVKYATAFVLMPGGMGTLDELFETLNLLQTGKIHRFPIILFGSDYWAGLLEWMKSQLLANGYIGGKDLDIFLIEDDPEVVADHVARWHRSHSLAELDQRPERRPRRALD
ncbi:MAG TPA: TIGR00730 family Rossman fold protein [Dehalococcoidia bacterium]